MLEDLVKDAIETKAKEAKLKVTAHVLTVLESIVEFDTKVSTRGSAILPTITYSFIGKYVYTKNATHVANFCNRTLKTLGSFLAKKTGLTYAIFNKEVRLKGRVNRTLIVDLEKKFYEEEVVCGKCKSPETLKQDSKVKCSSCGYTRISKD